MESPLIDALANRRLSDANEITRQLLVGPKQLTADYVGRITEPWSRYTDDLMGLKIQARLWKRLGGRDVSRIRRPDLFSDLGKLIGWRKDGRWVCLPNTPFATDDSFKVLPIESDPRRLPLGCLPFHNIVVRETWSNAFSPRDCWGEVAWEDWSQVYRLVLRAENS